MAGTGTAHLREPREALLRVEDLVVNFPAGGRLEIDGAKATIRLRADTVRNRFPAAEAWIAQHPSGH